jgi:hypothetical protein
MNSNLNYLLARERAAQFAREAAQARLAAPSRPERAPARGTLLLARLFGRRSDQRSGEPTQAPIHAPAEDAAT